MPATLRLLCAALVSACAIAQAPDPYTKGAAAALARAGYASLGPFVAADGYDTKEIERVLGEPICWIETAHFKIGASLASAVIADAGELARLRKRLPGARLEANGRADAWLRAHLFAQRAEELYAQIQKQLGVSDADFAPKEDETPASFLGMRGKFSLFLFRTSAMLDRFSQRFADDGKSGPRRYHDGCEKSLALRTCEDGFEGTLASDRALHCHVVYNVAQNLIDGYLGLNCELPVWARMGLAEWHVHRIDPRRQSFDMIGAEQPAWRESGRWEREVLRLVRDGRAPAAEQALVSFEFEKATFPERLTFWSRVDWLLRTDASGFAKYWQAMKEGHKRLPARDAILLRQESALKSAFGLDAKSFDERWLKWVVAVYPER